MFSSCLSASFGLVPVPVLLVGAVYCTLRPGEGNLSELYFSVGFL